MNKIELFKRPATNIAIDGTSPEALALRDSLLAKAKTVVAITDSQNQQTAVNIGVELRRNLKMFEAQGKDYKAPFKQAVEQIGVVVAELTQPLEAEIERIERLNVQFTQEEQRRIEAAQRERQRKIEEETRKAREAQAAADAAAAKVRGAKTMEKALEAQRQADKAKEQVLATAATQAPTISKAKGAAVKKVVKYRITDQNAMFAARPYCFKIEEKPSVITQTCIPNQEATADKPDRTVPGLEVWWELDSSIRARGQAAPIEVPTVEVSSLAWVDCKSSQIRRFAYTADKQILTMEFNSGGIYEYAEFPADQFEALQKAESVGTFLGQNIKGKYAFKRIN